MTWGLVVSHVLAQTWTGSEISVRSRLDFRLRLKSRAQALHQGRQKEESHIHLGWLEDLPLFGMTSERSGAGDDGSGSGSGTKGSTTSTALLWQQQRKGLFIAVHSLLRKERIPFLFLHCEKPPLNPEQFLMARQELRGCQTCPVCFGYLNHRHSTSK